MTHTPLTKVAERKELLRLHAATKHDQDWQAHKDFDDKWIIGVPLDGWTRYLSVCGDASKACAKLIVAARNALPRLLADLDAAEAALLCKGCGGTVGDHLAPDQGGCPGSFEIDGVQMVPLAGRDNAVAQRDRAEAERDALKAKLAALAEAAHQSVLIAKDESRGGPCGQAEPSLTINAEVRQRMKSIRVLLTPAIAAARGGAQ